MLGRGKGIAHSGHGLAWPGQSTNKVGFIGASGYVGDASGSGLTQWNGPFGGMAAYVATLPGGVITSGTPGNPFVVSMMDFVGPSFGFPISSQGGSASPAKAIHDVTFYGCRFQANTS